jgi:hypothetical protein
MHGIPIRTDRDNELGTISRDTIGTSIASEQAQPQDNAPANCRTRHLQISTRVLPILCPYHWVVKRALSIGLIVMAVVASYAPAVRNGFVWDDTALILRDPLIRSWRLIPEGFNHYLFTDATPSDFYRPLQRATYTIEYAFFCVNPAPYHLTNILLHAAAAVALMFFAEGLLGALDLGSRRSRLIALIAACLWAIHPVQGAAVVYVSGRADPLAAVFGFTGCYFAIRSLQGQRRSAVIFMIAAGVAFLLGALSKETGLVFPILAVVMLVLLKRHRAAFWAGVTAVFVAAFYLSLRLPAQHDPVPIIGHDSPWGVRPITSLRAVAEYAGLLLFPLNLHMERSVEAMPSSNFYDGMVNAAPRELQTLLGITLLALAVYWAFRARRRDRIVFILLVSAGLTYLPMAGIWHLNASVAEHWIYVPSAFLLLGLTVVVWRRIETSHRVQIFAPATVMALAVWTVFLSTRTFVRTFDWKDQRTFFERTIAAGGDSARMLNNLGGLELSENHLDQAKKILTKALKKEPDQPFAVINLAAVAIKQNDFKAARELLLRATKMPAVEAEAHELLTVLDNKESGRTDFLRLRLAAHTGPSNWSIEKRYIKLLAETGGTAKAIQELQTCLQSEWYRAESWQLLGQLLARTGRADRAAQAMAFANSYDVHLSNRPAPL